MIIDFNSKRCDYEQNKLTILILTNTLFQFQKERLWAASIKTIRVVWVNFNSKRCDYEGNAHNRALLHHLFQFQKVRLWVAISPDMSICINYFNSKRCDYERIQAQQMQAEQNFNSKRCDYESNPSNSPVQSA